MLQHQGSVKFYGKMKEVTCDYYEYLDGKPEGVRSYNGQYMSQYSWGEVTLAELCDRDDRE